MDAAVCAEIESLHQMKVGALRAKYRECVGKNLDHRISSSCFAASPGVCKRRSKEI
jgi:hypothetical protein